jgi:cytochrome oxidase Cu insertion factor (SCO1/SenC/PrrC family)
MNNQNVFRALAAGALGSLVPEVAQACAVCGLDGPGSIPTGALLFLMAMPFVIAGSIGAWLTFVHLRARRLDQGVATGGRFAWRRGMDAMRRPMFWVGLVLIITGVSAGVMVWLRAGSASRIVAESAPRPLEVYFEVPRFSLIDQNRQRITREDLLGRVWIANFIFTSCRTTCPRQSATMAQLQRDLAPGPDLRLVSITVDPDHDTPEVLTAYAKHFHADPQHWLFLTGEEKAIYSLALKGFRLSATRVQASEDSPIEQAFASTPPAPLQSQPQAGLRTAGITDDSRDDLVHDARFALVDRKARIRGYYSGLDAEAVARLRRDVRALLKEGG